MPQIVSIPGPFRIMMVDDHAMFLECMEELLQKIAPQSEISSYTSVQKAKDELSRNDYSFLLCDIMMPDVDTEAFISLCRKEFPKLIIIIITSILDVKVAKQYFTMGVDGFVSKAVGHYELRQAFEQTFNGNSYISTDLGGRFVSTFVNESKSELTKKELEVLRLLSDGYSVKKSAAIMHISPYTVSSHRRSIMTKLDMHSSAELIRYAFENKLQ